MGNSSSVKSVLKPGELKAIRKVLLVIRLKGRFGQDIQQTDRPSAVERDYQHDSVLVMRQASASARSAASTTGS